MKALHSLSLLSLIILLTFFISCDEDETIEPPGPTVTIDGPANSVVEAIGETVTQDFIIGASAGLKQLIVKINGSDLETMDYQDAFRETYTLNYTIPFETEAGATLVVSLQSVDAKDRLSEVVEFTIVASSSAKFRMEDTQLSGEDVIAILPVTGANSITFNLDTTLNSAKPYYLTAPSLIDEGATLKISEGAIIYTKAGSNIVVLRGSKIMAKGTAQSPVVFTSEKVLTSGGQAGDWGGIMLLGDASTNLGMDVSIPGIGSYGGSNDKDSSGEVSYVRIEYAGQEVNGFSVAFSMYAVGSGTIVHHLQTIFSGDEGVRIYGGAVNVSHLVSVACLSHAINFRHGWRGKGQFWVTQAPKDIYIDDARGIDARNDPDDDLNQPRTNPILTNFTLLGPGEEKAADPTNFNNRGLRIRQGAIGTFHNFLITDFAGDALKIEDVDLGAGNLVIQNGHVWGNDTDFDDQAIDIASEPANKIFNSPVVGVNTDQWIGSTGTEALDPKTLDDWFSAASYIGAIENEVNDWTVGWCKNENGSVR